MKKQKIPVAFLKIYNSAGDYVAACVDYTEAAVLVAFLGEGAQVRNGHAKKNAIWRESSEEQSASQSYDFAAKTMSERITPKDNGVPNQAACDAAQQGVEQARDYVRRVLAANA